MLLLALVLYGARVAPPLLPRGGPPPPSVLVFVLDDVAAADLALYGGPVEMPYLEQLAEAGVTFSNAYAHAWCAPTRRSLVFGHWWQNGNGGIFDTTPMANTPTAAETSIPEALSAHPSAMLGKWHLGGTPAAGPWEVAPLEHGFETWLAGVPGNVGNTTGGTYTNWLEATALALTSYTTATSSLYHPEVVRDYFRSGWLVVQKPALALVSPQLPHLPLHVPPASLLPVGYPTPVTQREKYEAMLRAFDTTLAQMLAMVELDETLIVVVGDNGTPPNVAPDDTKAKGTVFERGVRVPLIVAGGPTVSPGRVEDALVHAVDVYATAIDAGGGTVPTGTDSHSFLALLEGTTFTEREYAFLGNRWGAPGVGVNDRGAVSADGWKLRQVDTDGDGDVDVEALYDLTNDPGETTDALSSNLTLAGEIRTWLEAEAP
jgi:arylsulfatase A-like enzyme